MNVESMKEMGPPEEIRPGRPQRNYPAQERKRLLKLFEHSGLSAKRFCEARGIPVSTLSYWVRKSHRKPSGGAMVEILADAMHGATLDEHVGEPVPGSVEIRLPNQMELRISAGADTRWVTELLRGLLTCSG
jgi:transposase-like protein